MWITSASDSLASTRGAPMNCDLAYFERRASEERAAALGSADARARRVHGLMADCYDAKVQAMTTLLNSKLPALH